MTSFRKQFRFSIVRVNAEPDLLRGAWTIFFCWHVKNSFFASFTSRFVIDFLSIGKVIIFSAIATDDRHPTIRFRYIAQPRGVRKTYCARSRNDVRRLTSRSNAMPSKKTMESLEDIRSCRNCSKAWPNVSK